MDGYPLPLVAEDDRAHVAGLLSGAVARSPGGDIEFRITRKDGARRWVSLTFQSISSRDGRHLGYRTSIRDVTVRREFEEALDRSRAELAAVYDNAPVLMCTLDADHRVLGVNRAFEAFSGTREHLSGIPIADLLGCSGPADVGTDCGSSDGCTRCVIRAAVDDTILTGREHRDLVFSGAFRGPDGPVPVTLMGATARIAGGDRPVALLCLLDITAQVDAQSLLREAEERYRLLFSHSMDGILLTEPSGLVLDANPAACGMLGRSVAELRAGGRSLVADTSDPRLAAALAERARTGYFAGELRFKRADGTTFPAEVSTAIYEEGTGLRRTSMVIRDLSERQASEAALAAMSQRLQRAQDEERRRLARELHDSTAQRLAGLLMLIGRAQDARETAPAKCSALLQESVDLVQECTKEIRTMSHLLHPPLIDELGLEVALDTYLAGFSQRSGIAIQLDCPVTLPRQSAAIEIALFRVVQEALGNIHRHARCAEAVVRLWADATTWVLEVEDHGVGIPPDRLLQVQQQPTTVGVGVAGMKERLRQIGGTLDVVSGPGGTRVRATVPVAGSPIDERTRP